MLDLSLVLLSSSVLSSVYLDRDTLHARECALDGLVRVLGCKPHIETRGFDPSVCTTRVVLSSLCVAGLSTAFVRHMRDSQRLPHQGTTSVDLFLCPYSTNDMPDFDSCQGRRVVQGYKLERA